LFSWLFDLKILILNVAKALVFVKNMRAFLDPLFKKQSIDYALLVNAWRFMMRGRGL